MNVSGWIRNNVLGLIAIMIALGGTAVAANMAPRNSVTSKSIKNGQVKSKDLADGGVKAADVNVPSLTEGGLQARVGESCPDGFAISAIAGDGKVACEEDDTGPTGPIDADTLDGLDSNAFVADADSSGGDVSGPFANLQIGQGAVGQFEIVGEGVGTSEIAPNAVLTGEINDGAVQTEDVLNNTLTGDDVNESTLRQPAAAVFDLSGQSIAPATATQLTYESSTLEIGGVYSAATPGVLTAPTSGLYMVVASARWTGNANGYREICIKGQGASGSPTQCQSTLPVSGTDPTSQSIPALFRLAQGSTVKVEVRQTSANPIVLIDSSLSMVRLDPEF